MSSQYEAIMVPREPGADEEWRVLACAACAKSKQRQRILRDNEPAGRKKLRVVYREYLIQEQVEAVFSFPNLQAEIRDVAEALVGRPSDVSLFSRPCELDPSDCERKDPGRKLCLTRPDRKSC